MTMKDIKNEFANVTGFSKVEASKLVDAMYTLISDALIAGENIDIYGFGSLKANIVAEREMYNPLFGHHVVPEHRVLKFKCAPSFKRRLNGEE